MSSQTDWNLYKVSWIELKWFSSYRADTICDRQTDARGKTICLPTLKGGDIIVSRSISVKEWDQAVIKLTTPGSAVRHASVARHVTDCATRPHINMLIITQQFTNWSRSNWLHKHVNYYATIHKLEYTINDKSHLKSSAISKPSVIWLFILFAIHEIYIFRFTYWNN